eukprot:CAMPEP_0174385202 /NCGR_PEP_ID=MMETSP0811_2-20130205/126442_1 /TAXON_ID=73025 ORGANISM="Eutreptiella gymnastica-like, Strain CCMP1594" /NCGR_SAMPLE_ID=MMETSP0811_2 /ASSEMBLY_ACC=CAM_ASM_000667 /LENGTH=43 /DNA_ID= /DNA_START= /DNA_END= /DNA_ORIENTATION=
MSSKAVDVFDYVTEVPWGGIRNRRNLEWPNLAQHECTNFCPGI